MKREQVIGTGVARHANPLLLEALEGAESSLSTATEPRIVDDAAEHRYELWVGDDRAGVIEYGTRPGVIELIHTEIEPTFEGRGLGTRLIVGALDDIRARGLGLIPTCPFVRAYLRRHPEARDLVVRPSGRRG